MNEAREDNTQKAITDRKQGRIDEKTATLGSLLMETKHKTE